MYNKKTLYYVDLVVTHCLFLQGHPREALTDVFIM